MWRRCCGSRPNLINAGANGKMGISAKTTFRFVISTMSPRKKAQVAFASAVMLLFLSGLAAYGTITRLLGSEKWVIHTLEVRAAIGDIDSAFVRAGRARSGYVIAGTDDFLREFEDAAPEIPRKFQSCEI